MQGQNHIKSVYSYMMHNPLNCISTMMAEFERQNFEQFLMQINTVNVLVYCLTSLFLGGSSIFSATSSLGKYGLTLRNSKNAPNFLTYKPSKVFSWRVLESLSTLLGT